MLGGVPTSLSSMISCVAVVTEVLVWEAVVGAVTVVVGSDTEAFEVSGVSSAPVVVPLSPTSPLSDSFSTPPVFVSKLLSPRGPKD
eukprot:5718507-Amphidinium_carterae.1